jgi:hypothetical protein
MRVAVPVFASADRRPTVRGLKYREVQALTEVEGAIVGAIHRLGNPLEERLRAYLAEQGVAVEDFDATMRRIRAKGWVQRTKWKWHFTDAAIHHMR